MTPFLIVEDIHKAYGGTVVLKGISFQMYKGETKVIIGPSGTGKSTLLRCINRLTEPDQGRMVLDEDVIYDGENCDRVGDVNKIRSQIGMVFQDFNLFVHLNVLNNVRLGLIRVKRMSKKEATRRAMKELEAVGLSDKMDAYPAELSGGQKQRVSIARAVAMDPRLVLFDEPTSALDPELIGEVLEAMTGLVKKGMTMICVTHELGFASRVADEIIFLEGGKIIEQACPKELFNHPKHQRTRSFIKSLGTLYGERLG